MAYGAEIELWYAVKRLFNLGRLRRLGRAAETWPEAVADVFDWTILPADPAENRDGLFQVRGTLAITVGSERHYGVVYSSAAGEAYALEALAQSRTTTQLPVRYNPADPDQIIPVPTPDQLPFRVWLP